MTSIGKNKTVQHQLIIVGVNTQLDTRTHVQARMHAHAEVHLTQSCQAKNL